MNREEFLCPVNIDSLWMTGEFGSEVFDYVQFSLLGCDLGDECVSDAELVKRTFNIVLVNGLPNILLENSENYVEYAQDRMTYFSIDPTHT